MTKLLTTLVLACFLAASVGNVNFAQTSSDPTQEKKKKKKKKSESDTASTTAKATAATPKATTTKQKPVKNTDATKPQTMVYADPSRRVYFFTRCEEGAGFTMMTLKEATRKKYKQQSCP
jgi:hypothetical protein